MASSDPYFYLGRPLSKYSLQQLESILEHFKSMENERSEASKHDKFNKDREINNRKVPKMEFPPHNENYLNLKNAIELEIQSRNSNA